MITLLHRCYMMSSDSLIFSFGLTCFVFVFVFFLILEENGVNRNKPKTDDPVTEETKLDDS